VSHEDAYLDDPFYEDPAVGPLDYEGYKKQFESCEGIPFPWSPDPRASNAVDYAWELAYERWMAETERESQRRGDIEPDFEAG
jgi:hypothetical protein